MALAPTLSYTALDGDGDKATTEVHLPIGDTLARYTEFALAHTSTLEAIMNGNLDPIATLSIPVDISALTGNVATADSDVEQVAAFQFADTNNEPVNVNVPGLDELKIVAGSDSLDTADAEVAAFITLMEVGNGTIGPSSRAGFDIVDTFYARSMVRNSGAKR